MIYQSINRKKCLKDIRNTYKSSLNMYRIQSIQGDLCCLFTLMPPSLSLNLNNSIRKSTKKFDFFYPQPHPTKQKETQYKMFVYLYSLLLYISF
jgi:hypothetical protein